MMEGLRVCVCTVALALLVCVSLLTRALYWFMIMTGGLCLCLWQPVVRARCSLTKLCCTLLIRPPSLPPSIPPPAVRIEHVTGKPARYPPEDVETQRFSSGLQSSVSMVQAGLSLFPCRNLVRFFFLNPSEVTTRWRVCFFILDWCFFFLRFWVIFAAITCHLSDFIQRPKLN